MLSLLLSMNKIVMFLCVVMTVLCCRVQARSLDDIIESKQIVIAVYRDYAPFSAQVNGAPVGIDIDIARHIAKTLQVELRLKWITAGETTEDDLRNSIWKGHFLDKTKADVMMRVPYDKLYSQKRDDVGLLVHEQVHMFGPYHTETWKIVFNKQKIEEVTTMAVFQYHPVGVEVDSIPQFYLISAFRGSMRKNTRQFPSIVVAVESMQADEVDAVMGLRSQITALHHTLNQAQFQLAENAFPLIGKQKWDIGLAVHNDYRALSYKLGDIITAMINGQTMAGIFKTHNSTYEQPAYYMQ
jgi:polar amino acid transport system substrate-binding protein